MAAVEIVVDQLEGVAVGIEAVQLEDDPEQVDQLEGVAGTVAGQLEGVAGIGVDRLEGVAGTGADRLVDVAGTGADQPEGAAALVRDEVDRQTVVVDPEDDLVSAADQRTAGDCKRAVQGFPFVHQLRVVAPDMVKLQEASPHSRGIREERCHGSACPGFRAASASRRP